MTTTEIVSLSVSVVSLVVALLAGGRVVFRTEVKVEQHDKAIEKLEQQKADKSVVDLMHAGVERSVNDLRAHNDQRFDQLERLLRAALGNGGGE